LVHKVSPTTSKSTPGGAHSIHPPCSGVLLHRTATVVSVGIASRAGLLPPERRSKKPVRRRHPLSEVPLKLL